MDATLKTWMQPPATGLAPYVAEERAATAPTSAVQWTGLPFSALALATHAPAGGSAVAGFGARSTDLPGPGPRGAPV